MSKLITGIVTAALLGAPPAIAADAQTTKLLEDVLNAVNNSANTISTLKANISEIETANLKDSRTNPIHSDFCSEINPLGSRYRPYRGVHFVPTPFCLTRLPILGAKVPKTFFSM